MNLKPIKDAQNIQELIDIVSMGPEGQFRGETLPSLNLKPDKQKNKKLYTHQEKCIQQINSSFPDSGIIYLPTGSGKTRIAVELIKNRLNENPKARVIWATFSTSLIRQAMTRLLEQYHLFEKNPRLIWVKNDSFKGSKGRELFNDNDIVFATQENLVKILSCSQWKHRPIRSYLDKKDAKKRVLLIYDECHQLGAPRLQDALKKFYDSLDNKYQPRSSKIRFQFIGLGATPLPSNIQTHELLRRIFPVDRKRVSAEPSWNMMVFYKVTNRELVSKKILCPINRYFEKEEKVFDIPSQMLSKASKSLVDYQRHTDREIPKRLRDFERDLNKKIASTDEILKYLAKNIGDRLETLGKTIIFVALKEQAKKLAKYLKNHNKVDQDDVSYVYSGLEKEKVQSDYKEIKTNAQKIEDFKNKRNKPSIIINVGMLTTGFDDPAIQTVVLARYTFSFNLYWQMIGRGTRGKKSGGTDFCYLIDPFKLTEEFSAYKDYKPTFDGKGYSDESNTSVDEIGLATGKGYKRTARLDPSHLLE